MPPSVLVTWPDFDVEGADTGRALAAAGFELRLAPKRGARTPEELTGLARDAAGAIVSTDPFTADVLRASRALRVIARVGVGVDSIDLAAATERGVAVTVTPGANEDTVADHTLAVMLALLRRLSEHDAGVRRGDWNRTGPHTPRGLTGATVGVVGHGRIGRRVARRLEGFDVHLLVCDPALPAAGDPRPAPLDEVLARSDVVSLHCPLTPTTRHLIGRRELALMGPRAVLVNTARGGVVDEEALVDALQAGAIAGAALDVFAHEPPTGSPLLQLPNVLLSPHVAGLSTASVAEMTRRATQSVIDVLQGRVPADLANPDALGRWCP